MAEADDFAGRDLSEIDDATLAAAVRDRRSVLALRELLARHLEGAIEVVMARTRNRGLNWHDREDARQEAVLGVLATIDWLGTRPPGEPDIPFAAALTRVVIRDLQDADRHRSVARRLIPWSLPAGDTEAGRAVGEADPSDPALQDPAADPAEVAAQHEMWARLDALLDAVDPVFRHILEYKQSGGSLRGFARELRVPAGQVNRRWQSGTRLLQSQLRPYLD
jgi:RNA polymerase sigma factor (sigma-70 family)